MLIELLLSVRCRVSCFVRLSFVAVVESVPVELRFRKKPGSRSSRLFDGVVILHRILSYAYVSENSRSKDLLD